MLFKVLSFPFLWMIKNCIKVTCGRGVSVGMNSTQQRPAWSPGGAWGGGQGLTVHPCALLPPREPLVPLLYLMKLVCGCSTQAGDDGLGIKKERGPAPARQAEGQVNG